jgi:murein tripeptide amidase MpaA
LDGVLRALHNNDTDKALPRLQLASKQYAILKLELYRSTTSGKITNGNMSQMNMANADLSSPSLMAPTEEDKVTLLYQL